MIEKHKQTEPNVYKSVKQLRSVIKRHATRALQIQNGVVTLVRTELTLGYLFI